MKGFEVKKHKETVFLQLPILKGVKHAFGTRQGGKEILEAFGLSPGQLLTFKQVHGADVLILREDPKTLNYPLLYDAAITDREEVALGVWTADCLPILMWDKSKGVVATVHAGWRGLRYEIAQRTILRMKETFGSSPKEILVGIGPGIGPCCYEIGTEVVDLFRSPYGSHRSFIYNRGGRSYLDLCSVTQLQLLKAGVPSENMEVMPLCTACRKDLFFSYRRDGKTGRQLSFIMLG